MLVVKFPELSTWNPHEGLNRSVQISFLVIIRLAFVKLRYFELMDGKQQEDSRPCDTLIEDLIQETKTALTDWNVNEAFEAEKDDIGVLFYDELIQNACATIILLNRASYFSFYSIVSILTIFTNILETDEPAAIAHDMSLTVWFGAMLVEWTTEREELRPVETAINTLNDVCRQVKLCTSSIYTQPSSQLFTGTSPVDGIALDSHSVQTLNRASIEVHDLIHNPTKSMLVMERWIYDQCPTREDL
ncbi:hypothetical protein BBP40_000104 [Aspergillus hancockii]|nr:hypothetical protein BBP40_000104 [Aspergillus hancockii]